MIAMGITNNGDEHQAESDTQTKDNQETSKPGNKRKRKAFTFFGNDDDDDDFVPTDSSDHFDRGRDMGPKEKSNAKKRRPSRQKDDDDEDFVINGADNFLNQIESISNDFLVDVPGPSTSSFGSGRSSRLAAKKANEKLTKAQIVESLNDSQDSQEILNDNAGLLLNSHVNKTPKIVEEVFNKAQPAKCVDHSEDVEKLITCVNSKLKESFLLNHVQPPEEILSMDLPSFDVTAFRKLKSK